ncbi:VanZ family protein [Gorillibacterium timonense]|uniref:VanZ family protein n=1 Tax=Gorillibacterium timonense TaxID=1689269 RepID=UPI00071D9BBA|nr:VanZ family protein [Gorillibacterium timonense]
MGRTAVGKTSRIRWFRWLLVFAWMGLIFYFSSQTYQQQNLQPELREWIPAHFVQEHFSDVRFTYAGKEISVRSLGVYAFVEFFIRKGAHFGIYLMFALLLSWALTPLVRSRLAALLIPVMLGLAYAATDEVHQWFTGDRTPLVQDVLLDGTGALCGVLVYALFSGIFGLAAKRRSSATR